MNSLVVLAVERVPLVERSEPLLSFEAWLWIGLFMLVCIGVGGIVSVLAWRDRRSTSPEERAFRVLARTFGLGTKERAMLRTLASKSGIAEVALVLSEGAFDRAAEPGGRADPSEVQELRLRLFSDRSS